MEATKIEGTAAELRASNGALALRIPGRIEAAANDIIARSPDPAVRHRALAWKAETIPAYFQALFDPDPLVAFVDAWALSFQIQRDLESGPARDMFGPLQPVALDAFRRIQADLDVLALSILGPGRLERARSRVRSWAEENPIEGPLATRPSALPLLAEIAGDHEINLQAAVGTLTASFGDVAARLDTYAAYLPKAARWQAELAVDEIGGREALVQALADLRSLGETGAKAGALMSDAGIRRATAGLAEAARAERVALLEAIDRQRIDTLERVGREREAAFAEIAAERAQVAAAIDRQRALAEGQVEDLRRRTLADLDALSTRIVWKTVLALALLGLVGGAVWVVVARASRPRGRTAPAR